MANNNGAVAAPSASGGLLLDAIDIFLKQDKSFLNAYELGTFSMCSKSVQNLTNNKEENAVWENVFEKAVDSCKSFRSDGDATGDEKGRFSKITWAKENGLLECFQQPDEKTLAKVGYAHATRCLLTRHCYHCGSMTALVNPLTLTRICKECYMAHPEDWVAAKSKAKDAFRVSDKDLMGVPQVCLEGNYRFVLISDVKEVSFAKWGGADALETEILAKTQKAVAKFEKSQTSDKPQKKRPKIEKLSPRPADDLASINCFIMPIPIGTISDPDSRILTMQSSFKCDQCEASGSIMAVARHLRMQHGICLPFGRVPPPSPSPSDLVALTTLGVPQELIQVMGSATVSYGSGSKSMMLRFSEEFGGGPSFERIDRIESCMIRFADSPVVIAIDNSASPLECCEATGYFTVWCQLAYPNKVPSALLSIGMGENSGVPREGSARSFSAVLKALGLNETTPSQLLAALITRATPVDDFLEDVYNDNEENYWAKYTGPILKDALKILKAVGSDEEAG